MVTTQENDWHPQVNGVPWMQKARPGLRSARKPPFAALPLPESCQLPDQITLEKIMSTDKRKQRLLHETNETENGGTATLGKDVEMIVAAVLVLAIYWGAAAFAAGSAMFRRGDVVQRNEITLKYDKPMGGSVPAANPQNRAANVKDSGTQ